MQDLHIVEISCLKKKQKQNNNNLHTAREGQNHRRFFVVLEFSSRRKRRPEEGGVNLEIALTSRPLLKDKLIADFFLGVGVFFVAKKVTRRREECGREGEEG